MRGMLARSTDPTKIAEANVEIVLYSNARAREAASLLTRERIEEFDRRLRQHGWECPGGNDQSQALAVLRQMGISEETAQGFLGCCTGTFGLCSCKILRYSMNRILYAQ